MFSRFAQYGIGLTAGVAVLAGASTFATDQRRRCQVLAASPTKTEPTGSKYWEPLSSDLTGHGTKWDYNWDKRETLAKPVPEEDKSVDKDHFGSGNKKKSLPVRHIILIRHGQYNLSGATDKDRALTKLGREQAALVGKRLADLGLPYKALIHSTMTRARETARIISENIPDVPLSETSILEEGAPIIPDPRPGRGVGEWKPEHYFHQDGARIEAAFRQVFYRADPKKQSTDSYEIVVCHANVIRYFVCRALQFPPEGWLRMSLKHCSITWISVSGTGRVTLRSFGDAGFMPPEYMTTS